MPNISNVTPRVDLIRQSYKKFAGLGEKALANEFKMIIEGYRNLEYLVNATQLPPLKREMIESFGPHGIQFQQQGRVMNAHEVPITFIETLSGEAYRAIRDWVTNKRYLEVVLSMLSESQDGNRYTSVAMFDTWIELDGVDLSVEDATVLKVAGTLHCNWVTWFDPEDYSLSWT